jgi:hypothetical protein
MVTEKNASPNDSDPDPDPDSDPDDYTPDHEAAPSFVTRHPFVTRHRLGVTIGAAAVAVVLVSGLTAWGVGAAVAASYESATSATTAPVASAPPTSASRPNATRPTVVRGTIDSISGSTWTITTVAGATKQVTIGAATRYGTKKAPASASDFTVGTPVLVAARPSGTREIAVRVIMAKRGAHTQNTAPSTTS